MQKALESLLEKLIKTFTEDAKQVVRSSGLVAANYIEANESLSDRDFLHSVKISRKEAKETKLWLRLIECFNKEDFEKEKSRLIQEADELLKIFSTIIKKRSGK